MYFLIVNHIKIFRENIITHVHYNFAGNHELNHITLKNTHYTVLDASLQALTASQTSLQLFGVYLGVRKLTILS